MQFPVPALPINTNPDRQIQTKPAQPKYKHKNKKNKTKQNKMETKPQTINHRNTEIHRQPHKTPFIFCEFRFSTKGKGRYRGLRECQ